MLWFIYNPQIFMPYSAGNQAKIYSVQILPDMQIKKQN